MLTMVHIQLSTLLDSTFYVLWNHRCGKFASWSDFFLHHEMEKTRASISQLCVCTFKFIAYMETTDQCFIPHQVVPEKSCIRGVKVQCPRHGSESKQWGHFGLPTTWTGATAAAVGWRASHTQGTQSKKERISFWQQIRGLKRVPQSINFLLSF